MSRGKHRVDGRISYAHAVGDGAVLAEDAEMSMSAAARPEPTVPVFTVAKTPRGYVFIEYALPTSVAESAVVRRAEPDLRFAAIERLTARLDEEHGQ